MKEGRKKRIGLLCAAFLCGGWDAFCFCRLGIFGTLMTGNIALGALNRTNNQFHLFSSTSLYYHSVVIVFGLSYALMEDITFLVHDLLNIKAHFARFNTLLLHHLPLRKVGKNVDDKECGHPDDDGEYRRVRSSSSSSNTGSMDLEGYNSYSNGVAQVIIPSRYNYLFTGHACETVDEMTAVDAKVEAMPPLPPPKVSDVSSHGSKEGNSAANDKGHGSSQPSEMVKQPAQASVGEHQSIAAKSRKLRMISVLLINILIMFASYRTRYIVENLERTFTINSFNNKTLYQDRNKEECIYSIWLIVSIASGFMCALCSKLDGTLTNLCTGHIFKVSTCVVSAVRHLAHRRYGDARRKVTEMSDSALVVAARSISTGFSVATYRLINFNNFNTFDSKNHMRYTMCLEKTPIETMGDPLCVAHMDYILLGVQLNFCMLIIELTRTREPNLFRLFKPPIGEVKTNVGKNPSLSSPRIGRQRRVSKADFDIF